jgi:1-acyl-sn-glycerol-3-phosphate acyltransferase
MKLFMIGHRKGDKNPAWKVRIIKLYAKIMARLESIIGGGLFFSKHERINVDYKKYLGPEWKPTYDGASTYVCNHSSWLDIMICAFAKDFPIYTPKSGIRRWPVIGKIAEDACESYFINRAGTKEERE